MKLAENTQDLNSGSLYPLRKFHRFARNTHEAFPGYDTENEHQKMQFLKNMTFLLVAAGITTACTRSAKQLPIYGEKEIVGTDTIYHTIPDFRFLDQDSNRSEEHTSELQSLMRISYAVFCLKKKNTQHD